MPSNMSLDTTLPQSGWYPPTGDPYTERSKKKVILLACLYLLLMVSSIPVSDGGDNVVGDSVVGDGSGGCGCW